PHPQNGVAFRMGDHRLQTSKQNLMQRLVHRRRDRILIEFHEEEINEYAIPPSMDQRSEEHTSELQSRSDLVCRLLLEKKKQQILAVEPLLCGDLAAVDLESATRALAQVT